MVVKGPQRETYWEVGRVQQLAWFPLAENFRRLATVHETDQAAASALRLRRPSAEKASARRNNVSPPESTPSCPLCAPTRSFRHAHSRPARKFRRRRARWSRWRQSCGPTSSAPAKNPFARSPVVVRSPWL